MLVRHFKMTSRKSVRASSGVDTKRQPGGCTTESAILIRILRCDFSEQTRRALALRTGLRCSRPECGALTSGPQDDPTKAVNVGVAAHITAASVGGPRFDPQLTLEERASAGNGIWLCQNCAKLIDSDVARFTIEVLQRWKIDREAQARRDVGRSLNEPEARGLIVEVHLAELVEVGVAPTQRFLFKVANPHTRPATIVGAGIEAPSAGISAPVFSPLTLWNPPRFALPWEITDGQSATFSSDVEYFESELRSRGVKVPVEIFGYVSDALGNRHDSKSTTYDRSLRDR